MQHILEYHPLESSLYKVFFRGFECNQQPFFQTFVLLEVDSLKNRESERAVEAAAIATCFAVVAVVLMQVLHFDVEAFVVDELVEHEGDGTQVADERGLGLDL